MLNRRNFIMAAMALSPLAILRGGLDDLLVGMYRSYRGEQKELKTYLMLNMFGAPARWVYDNNLRPHPHDEIITDKVVFTNFVASSDDHYDLMTTPVEYSTVSYKNWQMPKLWGASVYFRGELVPMTQILPNMLSIRGVWQGIGSHPVGNLKQICVRNGDVSISGLVADSSQRPIPAVSLGASPAGNAFKSETGKAQLDISYENSSPDSNLIHYLTRSFTNAELGLPENFDPLTEYNKLVDKYTRILSETYARCPIPGLTDKPFRVKEFSAPSHKELMTAINKFKLEGGYMIQHDYTSAFSELQIGSNKFIEKQFALAEFILLNKLSSSIVLSPPKGSERVISNIRSNQIFPLEDLKVVQEEGKFKIHVPPPTKDIYTVSIGMDNHGGGSFFGATGASLFFQGYTACIMELVQTLKDNSTEADNLFANTVIHLASEFDRGIPACDGDSDHLGDANPVSLISGMINEYQLIGNIRVKSNYWSNTCTLGEAAPVHEHGGELLQTEHILSSITTVLGGRELSFRHPSILQVKDNKITTHFKEPKNIKS